MLPATLDGMLAKLLHSVVVVILLCVSVEAAKFPNRPIKILVYTAPGGPIDFTARQFAEIARKYTDATFVIENKPGAGGVLALEYLTQARPDGYTLLACTKSNIAKMLSSGHTDYFERVDWFALLIRDRECVITRRDAVQVNWDAIVADARQRPGEQLWLGPGSGGLDHVTAMQVWDAFGINARWVPFKSGGEALTTLLGGSAAAYVGNPSDATSNPNLQVSVVSSPQRLPQFPNTPTFGELGHPELDDKFMWRGFAFPMGCPEVALTWFDDLARKVTADPDWKAIWQSEGMEVVYLPSAEFKQVIAKDRNDFQQYLAKLDLLPLSSSNIDGLAPVLRARRQLWIFTVALSISGVLLSSIGQLQNQAYRLLSVGVIGFAGLLYWQTFEFPVALLGIGAAAIPRFWIACLALLSIIVVYSPTGNTSSSASRAENPEQVLQAAPRKIERRLSSLIVLLAAYLVSMPLAGYYVSSILFLVLTSRLLGERRIWVSLTLGFGWLLIAYVGFQRLLYVPLPIGRWFASN